MTQLQMRSSEPEVLIVSSDDEFIASISDQLSASDFGVAISTSGETIDSDRPVKCQVSVVDVDGMSQDLISNIEGIRMRHATLVIACATQPSVELLTRLIRAGVYDFFEKPLDASELTSKIRFLCDRKTVHDVHDEMFRRLKTSNSRLDRSQIELSREIVRATRELQQLNKTLKRHVSQLTILYQMGRDISENENWSDALDRFLMALVNYIEADGAALLLFSVNESRLAERSNFQVDPPVLAQSCQVLLDSWRANPRGSEIHAIENYKEHDFATCLERARPWRFTIIPLRHRSRTLGFLLIEKDYRSHTSFKIDYLFLNTIQTIIGEEVANATYISELRQLGRFNQKVLDNINSGVITTDLIGNVRFFNQRASDYCPGLRHKDPPHFDEVFYRSQFGRHFYQSIINSSADTHVLDVTYRGARDKRSPARLNITKMHDDNLNGTVLVAIFEDLTEQKRLEAELRRNDRLRALGQLSAGVAHEIRNPLTGIATSAELLGESLKSDPKKSKFIRAILDEIHRLDDIIRSLLSFARPAKPHFDKCDLPKLSQHVVTLLAEEARKKGVQLEVDNELNAQACRADTNQLTQVLLNLVLNSIQACTQGDDIRISLKSEPNPPSSGVGFARIEVVDSGPGVPEEVRANLFDPFVTTKSSGTGLGLAITQQIVEEHEGEISCHFLDDGTQFTIRLPLHSSDG